MEDKSLELLTPEGRRFYEEWSRCETMEEIEELEKRWAEYYASREPEEIPHYDMTLEELDKKYGLVSHEEVWKKQFDCEFDEMMLKESANWTPSQWAAYLTKGQTFDDQELDSFIEEEIIEK